MSGTMTHVRNVGSTEVIANATVRALALCLAAVAWGSKAQAGTRFVSPNGNTAPIGAGIFVANTTTIEHATIANNSALMGAGGLSISGTRDTTRGVSIGGTILANNFPNDCDAPFTSLGYNLVGSNIGCWFKNLRTDLTFASANLGPLQNKAVPQKRCCRSRGVRSSTAAPVSRAVSIHSAPHSRSTSEANTGPPTATPTGTWASTSGQSSDREGCARPQTLTKERTHHEHPYHKRES